MSDSASQEGLGVGVFFPAVLLEQLVEAVEQVAGILAAAEAMLGHGQECQVLARAGADASGSDCSALTTVILVIGCGAGLTV